MSMGPTWEMECCYDLQNHLRCDCRQRGAENPGYPHDKKTRLVAVKKEAQTGQLMAGATIKATLLRSNTPPLEAGQSFTETTGYTTNDTHYDVELITSKTALGSLPQTRFFL